MTSLPLTTTTTNPLPFSTSLSPISEFDHTPEEKSNVYGHMDLGELMASSHLDLDILTRTAYRQALQRASQEEAELITTNLILRRQKAALIRRKQHAASMGHIVSQSEAVGEMTSGVSVTLPRETLLEHPGESPEVVSALRSDPVLPGSGMSEQFTLDNFFSRPVAVYSGSWALGSYPNVAIPVWDIWSKEPSVRAKLLNYRYFSGELEITIAVTGTPFHYGKVLVSYQPYPTVNDNLAHYRFLFSTGQLIPGQASTYVSYLSQAHDVVTIDVRDNEPVIVNLPFISPKNSFCLDAGLATVVTPAQSFKDFQLAGDLILAGINPISSANEGVSTPVTVTVYARAVNVNLAVPTSTNMTINAQSKKKKSVAGPSKAKRSGGDEYDEEGPVTKIASALGVVGTKLADVPVIGPFASAAGNVATAVSKFTALFGWSRPAQLDATVYVKNNPFTNGATTAGRDTTYKVSVDPKQALTPYAQNGGCDTPKDELSIASLCAREAYVGSFQWVASNVSLVDYLAQIAVTPQLTVGQLGNTGATPPWIQQGTPLSFTAGAFAYWRGSITYRLEIVCSRFHRGKFLIGFEPNLTQWQLIKTAPTSLNEHNTMLIDIQETQEVEFTVEWCSEFGFMRMYSKTTAPNPRCLWLATNQSNTLTVPAAINNQSVLGMVYVQPFTTLVQPVATAPVYINVYVRSDDMQFAGPSASFDTYRPVSQSSKDVLVSTGASQARINQLHFGEVVGSLREMLKRYHTSNNFLTYNFSTVAVNSYLYAKRRLYPLPDSEYESLAASGNRNLFQYLRYGFLGMKGGMRYRSRFSLKQVSPSPYEYIIAGRINSANPATVTPALLVGTGIGSEAQPLTQFEGANPYCVGSNGGVEYEVPYYSPNMWQFSFGVNEGCNEVDYVPGFMVDETPFHIVRLAVANATNVASIYLYDDISIAEDFNFFHFMGAPHNIYPLGAPP